MQSNETDNNDELVEQPTEELAVVELTSQRLELNELLSGSALLLLVGVILLAIFPVPWSWNGSLGCSSLVAGILSGIVLYGVIYYLSAHVFLHYASVRTLTQKLITMFGDLSWSAIVMLSLFAGFGEELLFRVFIQTLAVDQFGVLVGIVSTSIIFGLLHYLSKLYVVMAFAISVVFGFAYWHTNSYLFVAIAHTIYDICAFAVIVKYPHLLKLDRYA